MEWVLGTELNTETRKDSRSDQDLVDRVYDQLLVLLQRKGLLTVEALNVLSIAKELGVSRTPVNMAMIRLERDGLVQKLPGGGWATVAISRKDLAEVFELRDVLDRLILRKAAERVTPDAIKDLFGLVEEMKSAAQARDVHRWLALDHDYENRIIQLAGNGRVLQIREQLRGQLLRMILSAVLMSDRMTVSAKEHERMTEALASGDADRAVEEGLKHLESMRITLLNLFDNILEPLRARVVAPSDESWRYRAEY